MTKAIPTTEEIVTSRCRLRYPDESDIVHIWSATRVEGFNDGMPWDPPAQIEDLEGPLQRSHARWTAGTHYNWTVENRRTGEFIGRISIRQEGGTNEWSIGFWTHPLHQGHGYATEAAKAIIKLGFERLHAVLITAGHATWNQASARVLEGAGMKFARVNPKGFKKHGEWVEENEYEIHASAGSA